MAKCKTCGAASHEPCSGCGQIVHIGEWYNCPHGYPNRSKGFEPYFSHELGKWVSGVGDINQEMRPKWEGDHIVRLESRGRSAAYFREKDQRREARMRGEI